MRMIIKKTSVQEQKITIISRVLFINFHSTCLKLISIEAIMGKNTKTKPITVIFSFSNEPCNCQGLWNLKEIEVNQ